MRALRAVGALLFLGLATTASAADDGWKLEKEADGIRIESRAVPGWSINEMRGTARIQAPLSAVVAVLEDSNAASKLNELVAENRIVKRDSPTSYRTYAALKMPWPVTNRDIYNQRDIRVDAATKTVVIEDKAVNEGEPRKGYVRIVKSTQRWTLKPTADGQTDAELRLLSDPDGIPASIINSMAVSTPYKTIVKVRELSQQAPYAQAKPAFLE